MIRMILFITSVTAYLYLIFNMFVYTINSAFAGNTQGGKTIVSFVETGNDDRALVIEAYKNTDK